MSQFGLQSVAVRASKCRNPAFFASTATQIGHLEQKTLPCGLFLQDCDVLQRQIDKDDGGHGFNDDVSAEGEAHVVATGDSGLGNADCGAVSGEGRDVVTRQGRGSLSFPHPFLPLSSQLPTINATITNHFCQLF